MLLQIMILMRARMNVDDWKGVPGGTGLFPAELNVVECKYSLL